MDLLEKLIAKTTSLPYSKINSVIFITGFTLLMYSFAEITWKLVPTKADEIQWRPSAIAAKTQSAVDISSIEKLSLFGKASAQAERTQVKPVEEVITDAPKTSLSIQLTGVVASTKQTKGLAVISSGGGENTYSIGEKIKSTSASLKEVYVDRIIITNNGRYETLMLDGLKYETGDKANRHLQRAKSENASRVDRRNNRRVSQSLGETRAAILSDPSKITDFLAISPVRGEDGIQGYRLNPGKDRDLFTNAGFKSNDLAKSINGYDLTDPGQALEVMGLLPELTEVSIMVERDNQLTEIMFGLPQNDGGEE